MKRILNILAVSATALLVAHTTLHATVNQVVNTVAITASALQESGTTVAVGVSKTPAPVKLSVTTKSILNAIAVVNNVIFPIGAKLVAVQSFGNAPTYLVFNKSNVQLLVNTSFITSGRPAGNNVLIHSGSFSTVTQLGFPSQTNYEFYVFNYNAGGVAFSMFGQMTHTRLDTKPSALTLIYSESQTNKTTAMAGSGTSAGNNIVITGTLSYSGSSAQQL